MSLGSHTCCGLLNDGTGTRQRRPSRDRVQLLMEQMRFKFTRLPLNLVSLTTYFVVVLRGMGPLRGRMEGHLLAYMVLCLLPGSSAPGPFLEDPVGNLG